MPDDVNVGAIKGQLILDDSLWDTPIDRAQAKLDKLTSTRANVQIDVDTARAAAGLSGIQAAADKLGADKLDISVQVSSLRAMGDLSAIWAEAQRVNAADVSIDINIETQRAQTLLKELEAEANKARQAIDNIGSGPGIGGGSGGGGGGGGGLLGQLGKLLPGGGGGGEEFSASSAVTPAAVLGVISLIGPATASATAGLIGFAGAAGVAGLAYKGLSNDIAYGTTLGLSLQKQFSGISGEVSSLEAVAAQAISGGLLGSLHQVDAFLPTLQSDVDGIGRNLGSALNIGTGALITGLKAADPLLTELSQQLVVGARDLDNFAASPKFAQFVAYAQQELPKVEQFLGDVTVAAVNTVVALQPVGDDLIRFTDDLAQGYNKAKPFIDTLGRIEDAAFAPAKAIASIGKGISNIFGSSKPDASPLNDQINSVAATQADSAASAADAAAAQKALGVELAALDVRYGVTAGQADAYTNIVGRNSGELHDGAITMGEYRQALSEVTAAENGATVSGSALLAAMTTFASSAGNAADKGALIGAVLKAGNGDALSYAGAMVSIATANQQFVTDFDNARFAAQKAKTSFTDAATGVIDLKTGALNYHNAAAGPLISDLQQLQDAAAAAASATYQHEVATKGQSQAASDAAAIFKTDTYGALVAEAKQLGLTAGQAQNLASQYFNMPASTTTTVKAIGLNDVNETLNNLGQQLSYLTGHPWNVAVSIGVSNNVGQAVHDAVNSIQASVPHKAGGGVFTGPGSGTSDSILAAVSNGESVNTKLSTDKNLAAILAGNKGAKLVAVPTYADGGFVGVTAPTDPSIAAAAAAAKKVTTGASALATSRANIDFTISADVSKVLGAGSYSALQSAITSLTDAVHSGLAKGVGSGALVATLQADNSKISALATKRASDYASLSAATAKLAADETKYTNERSTVASAVTGGFDITSLSSGSFDAFGGTSATGSASDAIAALQARVTQAGTFKTELATLGKLGLNPALLQQLAEAGVSGGGASAAELAGASKGQIAQINALSGQINSYGSSAGNQIAGSLFGSTIASDAKAVKSASQKVVLDDTSVAKIAAGIATAIKGLGITVSTDSSKLLGVIDAEIKQNNKALLTAATYR